MRTTKVRQKGPYRTTPPPMGNADCLGAYYPNIGQGGCEKFVPYVGILRGTGGATIFWIRITQIFLLRDAIFLINDCAPSSYA